MKILRTLATIVSVFALLSVPAIASAHVIITPGHANVGEELVFSVSVPNERQVPVTTLKIDIPSDVTEVMPTAKDGWITTTAAGKSGEVTSIVWSGGTIPVGQRQDFSFSATAPGQAGEVDWKAYQTYADGTVVHWDQKPAGSDDASGDAGPYSVTSIVNDLAAQSSTASAKPNNTPALALSIAALIVSIGTLLFRNKQ